ncbi:MAG: ATP-binding protein [Planctomycetes bacterium]|nr:ATP-binding protein [Planctomycetota bacterium]
MLQTEESATARGEVQSLRQQLLQAQRLCSLGALATSVTHEFNNILTAITNHAKLALNNTDGAARTKSLEKIMLAAERAAKITKGMLGLARAGSPDRKLTDIVELVREVLVLTEKDLSKHRVKLETRFRGRPGAVVFACQIQQILLNLIINARQAMPRGGNLLVEVRENAESNMAEIVVADTGVGIPPEKLRHIFDPFFTTKSGPDETGKGGTGLGLAICRDIIEAHNGRIRVESLVGRGSTFTVKLPVAPSTQQAVA